MIERVWDATLVAPAIKHFLNSEDLVDPIEWLANPVNIVLVNDRGDMALFEYGVKNIYAGHYFFKSRGRNAITAGLEFLDNLFNTCYNINVVTGLVPLQHLGARWLTRRLGFTGYGVVDVDEKHYEHFILTRVDFNVSKQPSLQDMKRV